MSFKIFDGHSLTHQPFPSKTKAISINRLSQQHSLFSPMALRHLFKQKLSLATLAMVAVLAWAQVANAHHLVSHAQVDASDSELCDQLHSPAVALSITTGASYPTFAQSAGQPDYQGPLLATPRFTRAATRAPPSATDR